MEAFFVAVSLASDSPALGRQRNKADKGPLNHPFTSSMRRTTHHSSSKTVIAKEPGEPGPRKRERACSDGFHMSSRSSQQRKLGSQVGFARPTVYRDSLSFR
jgi:hypothetical protein